MKHEPKWVDEVRPFLTGHPRSEVGIDIIGPPIVNKNTVERRELHPGIPFSG